MRRWAAIVTTAVLAACAYVPIIPFCQGGAGRIVNVKVGLECVTIDVGADVDVAFDDTVVTH